MNKTSKGDWRPVYEPIKFAGLGMCFYEAGEFRAPKTGEFYVNQPLRPGDAPMAWQATIDFPDRLQARIVRPTHHAIPVTRHTKGPRVMVTPMQATTVIIAVPVEG